MRPCASQAAPEPSSAPFSQRGGAEQTRPQLLARAGLCGGGSRSLRPRFRRGEEMGFRLRRLTRTVGVALVILAVVLPLGSQAAFAMTGDVLASFVPGGVTGNGRGIAFDGTNLYYTLVDDPHIYKVSATGTPLGSITVAGGAAKGGPLSWDGSALWTANYSNTHTLLRVNASTGAIISSCDFVAANPGNPAVNPATGIGNFPDGLDWTGSTNWMSGEGAGIPGNWVAELDTSCHIIRSFTAPSTAIDGTSGVAFVPDPFNGDRLWHPHPQSESIVQTDTAGVLTGPTFTTAPREEEDLAFDQVTFAPKCAVWANEATLSANHLTAYEVPCPERPITATGTTINAVEGASFSGMVATFTDPDPNATASEYAATIDWGDGPPTAGTITGPTGGPFTVSGTHTYKEEGTYAVTVVITDVDTPTNNATAHSTAHVADAPLTPGTLTLNDGVEGVTPTTATFTFTDANSFATTADFTATFDWGDTTSSAGIVAGPTGGPFTVSGTHTYSSTGFFTITVSIADDGGSTATTSCVVLIFGTSAGGNFVIGDQNSALGTDVTFWGAQWAKLNTLSGGAAPSAFKGFEDTPSTAPACGTNWSTDPGNSTPPPAGPLPEFMAVIVSSSITKAGPTISGNTPHVVVVHVAPGYVSNPGHPGTGTVVAIVC